MYLNKEAKRNIISSTVQEVPDGLDFFPVKKLSEKECTNEAIHVNTYLQGI